MTLTRNLSSPLVYTSAKVLLMSLWGVASCQAFSFLVGSHFSGLKLKDIFNIYNIYYYIIIFILMKLYGKLSSVTELAATVD